MSRLVSAYISDFYRNFIMVEGARIIVVQPEPVMQGCAGHTMGVSVEPTKFDRSPSNGSKLLTKASLVFTDGTVTREVLLSSPSTHVTIPAEVLSTAGRYLSVSCRRLYEPDGNVESTPFVPIGIIHDSPESALTTSGQTPIDMHSLYAAKTAETEGGKK